VTSVKLIGAACFALAFAVATPAAPQTIDVGAMRCKEFMEIPTDRAIYILLWLDGYYTGEDDEPVINFNDIQDVAKKLRAYCTANPNAELLTAADEAFGN
jgi:acid stress chaperone HdeB